MSIIITLISLTIAYIIYTISIILFGIISKAILPDIELKNTLVLVCVGIIASIILYSLFKVKRFKNGFSFFVN